MPQHSWLRLRGLHHIYGEKEPALILLQFAKTPATDVPCYRRATKAAFLPTWLHRDGGASTGFVFNDSTENTALSLRCDRPPPHLTTVPLFHSFLSLAEEKLPFCFFTERSSSGDPSRCRRFSTSLGTPTTTKYSSTRAAGRVPGKCLHSYCKALPRV